MTVGLPPPETFLYQCTRRFHASCFWSDSMRDLISSPDSLNRLCLSPLKAIWKLHCACLNSLVLDHCALWSAALMSVSQHLYWEIQDARAFIVRVVLEILPLISLKAAPPLVWGRNAFGCIGKQVFPPVGNDDYVALPLSLAPPGLAYVMCHEVFSASPH